MHRQSVPKKPTNLTLDQNLLSEARSFGVKLSQATELGLRDAVLAVTSLQLKLIRIGARVVRHARAITFQLAEVAVTGPMPRVIFATIRRLRAPPLCA